MRVSIGHKISFPKGTWKRGCAAQRRRGFFRLDFDSVDPAYTGATAFRIPRFSLPSQARIPLPVAYDRARDGSLEFPVSQCLVSVKPGQRATVPAYVLISSRAQLPRRFFFDVGLWQTCHSWRTRLSCSKSPRGSVSPGALLVPMSWGPKTSWHLRGQVFAAQIYVQPQPIVAKYYIPGRRHASWH